MNVLEAILSRRSVRKFTNEPVTTDEIKELIKYAMFAPSAVNKQPWHFIIIDNRHIMEEVVKFHPHAAMLLQAAAAVLICGDEELAHTSAYWPVDCSAATQNFLLAAHGKGLGAVWLGIYPREERISAMKALMNLPEHIHPFSLIALGHHSQEPRIPDRYKPERIHLNKW
ncbi:MAG: nitroreductase family protein [Bacteroidetes bacterium]|nr:nitroreductase family protein [Bacteroidota bacterium]